MSAHQLSGPDPAQWWPTLSESAREWLVANNGDAVPESVVKGIEAVAGVGASSSVWIGDGGPNGVYLADAATDWIEEAAIGEH